MSIACVVGTRAISSILSFHDRSQLPLDPGRNGLGRSIDQMRLIRLKWFECPDDLVESFIRHMCADRGHRVRLPALVGLGDRYTEPDRQWLGSESHRHAA